MNTKVYKTWGTRGNSLTYYIINNVRPGTVLDENNKVKMNGVRPSGTTISSQKYTAQKDQQSRGTEEGEGGEKGEIPGTELDQIIFHVSK